MTDRRSGWMSMGWDGAQTALVAFVGLVLAALITTFGALEIGGAVAVGLYGAALVDLLATATILYAASHIPDRLVRSTWILVAASVLFTGIGELLWAYAYLSLGVTEAGLSYSDVFYLAAYVAMAVGLLRYAISFRARVDFAWIATETLATTAILGATLWVVFLTPVISAIDTPTPALLADLTYIFLDFPLLLAPILCLLLVMVRLRDHNLASPWAAVTLGILATIAADIVWFWERAHGGWAPGSIADFGFMAASVMFATGAMAAVDSSHRIERLREAGVS